MSDLKNYRLHIYAFVGGEAKVYKTKSFQLTPEEADEFVDEIFNNGILLSRPCGRAAVLPEDIREVFAMEVNMFDESDGDLDDYSKIHIPEKERTT